MMNIGIEILEATEDTCSKEPFRYHAAARAWLDKVRGLRSQGGVAPDITDLEKFFFKTIPEPRG